MSRERDSVSVTVERNGEQVVCISTYCLSGRDLIDGDAEVIKDAAQHLLAFVGATNALAVHSSMEDVPGWNPIALAHIDQVVKMTCSQFRASDHGNAKPRGTGELARCVNCNEPQWKHWLESARVVMADRLRPMTGRDMRSAGQ